MLEYHDDHTSDKEEIQRRMNTKSKEEAVLCVFVSLKHNILVIMCYGFYSKHHELIRFWIGTRIFLWKWNRLLWKLFLKLMLACSADISKTYNEMRHWAIEALDQWIFFKISYFYYSKWVDLNQNVTLYSIISLQNFRNTDQY